MKQALGLLLLLSAAFLTGCGSTGGGAAAHKPKDVVFVPGPVVKVPISQKCKVDVPDEPRYEIDAMAIDSGYFDKLRAVLIEIEQRRDYIMKLRAEAKKCE